MTESVWRSMHVAYYAANPDALLHDVVAPLFDEIGVPAYFVRHWRRGPHLRLNFRTDADTFTTVIAPRVREVVGAHLARYPSRKQLAPQQLLPLHRRYAEIDGDTGQLVPWYADNTIHDALYERPVIGFTGESAAAFSEKFYCDTNSLVFDTVERVGLGQTRLGLLFDIWIATAHALAGEIEHGWLSYRSHADYFRHRGPDPVSRLRGWDERYAGQKDEFGSRATAVAAAIDADRPGSAREWVDLMRPVRERARTLVDQGLLTFPGARFDEATAPDMRFRLSERELSPFHRALVGNDEWSAFSRTPEFLTYRVVLTLTYAHASRVGITLLDRYFLCHLAAKTMEDKYGVEGADLAAGLLARNLQLNGGSR
ncbi:thiopeptide maturation pyridine synthase [Nocardia sp. NPDC058480]|uniref:thiopeptide maturation pyridine synthase n=1 Tax=unclassified Nocardia TaxID=2637762 RepID=UPI003649514F